MNNLKLTWGRNGLHVWRGGREIALVDCYRLALLHISYGDDLDGVPEGWYISRRERIEKWIREGKAKK